MSGGPQKFGAFGGVFTPSVLTILGVIMYLRLPWVVGNAGLYAALGIVIVAHVISVTTGLSISSIATDKRVGAGGPYYVISRSLGLPIGGTIGLALFIGLSFSISLYVIGFSESLLAFIGQEATLFNIRVCGTATIVTLTIITFISTSLAIKTQYIILGLIALSLVSIFSGSIPVPAEAILEPPSTGAPLALLFGVFFPAVTGFTAGVNMSGDLDDPKRAIPLGTIAAIGVGLVVYIGLTIFLAYRVDPGALRDDPELLQHVARWPMLVVGGVWGATLSSALGSILGAPRILQSMSADRVTPRFFAKGAGATNEPRRALVLAFLVGEAGILIGELDVIARVVSMVFLALYGVINFSFAIESWASPDFRPSFRITKWFGIIGAATCLLVMIQLDPLAMAASMVLMLLLFAFLSRRRLTLDSGDTWEGVWSSLVRTGLRRLAGVEMHRRNWKPNILAFSRMAGARERELRDLAIALIGNVGIATDFEIVRPAADVLAAGGDPDEDVVVLQPVGKAEEEIPAGLFEETLESGDPFGLVANLARHHGFAGVRPNSVLVPWSSGQRQPRGFAALAETLDETEQNLLMFAPGHATPGGTIDVWWYDELGNLALGVTLARLLSRSDRWVGHNVRILLLTKDPAIDDLLSVEAREYVREARLTAEVLVRHVPPTDVRFQDVVARESADAALVLVPLPSVIRRSTLDAYEEIADLPGHMLAFRPQRPFDRILRAGLEKPGSIPPPAGDEEESETTEVVLPEHPSLAEATLQFEALLREATASFNERCIARYYDTELPLQISRTLSLLARSVEGESAAERLELVAQWMEQTTETLAQAVTRVEERRRVFDEAVSTVLEPSTLSSDANAVLVIGRRKDELMVGANDSSEVIAIKKSMRFRMLFAGKTVKSRVPIGVLQQYYRDQVLGRIVERNMHHARLHHAEASLALGRTLSSLGRDLAVVDLDTFGDTVERCKGELERITETLRERRAATFAHAAKARQEIVAEFATDIDRLDVGRHSKRSRGTKKRVYNFGLDGWQRRATLLAERAHLGLRLGTVLQEIRRAAHSLEAKLVNDVLSEVVHRCTRLREALETIVDEGTAVDLFAPEEKQASWDPRSDLDEFATAIADATAELPERFATCNDEALLHGEGKTELTDAEVALRRGVDVAARHELLVRIEDATTRAHAVSDEARKTLDELTHMIALQRRADAEESDVDAMQSTVERASKLLDERLEALAEAEASLRLASREGRSGFANIANAYDLEALRSAATGRAAKAKVSVERKSLGRGLRDGIGRTMGGLLYRRSHGVLLAMKLRTVSEGAAAQTELRRLVRAASPRRDVLETLPPFYQQLFLARGAPGGPFRVPRARQEHALSAGAGLMLVIGEPGSGKTSQIQQIAAALSPPSMVWVQTPAGGATSVREMERALVHGSRWSSAKELLGNLVDGSLVVIDDLELWWERREGGLGALEHLLSLINDQGHRLRFIIGVNEHAYAIMDRLVPLTASAVAVERCQPFSAEELRHAIMRRHQSTGFRFTLNGRDEAALGEWDLARLFSAHFDQSAGNLSAALRGWLARIDACGGEDGQLLTIHRPAAPPWDALDDLDGDAKTLLLNLILHKEASRARLFRVMGQPDRALNSMLRGLTGSGVITRHPSRGYGISPYLRHHVITHFRHRGLT